MTKKSIETMTDDELMLTIHNAEEDRVIVAVKFERALADVTAVQMDEWLEKGGCPECNGSGYYRNLCRANECSEELQAKAHKHAKHVCEHCTQEQRDTLGTPPTRDEALKTNRYTLLIQDLHPKADANATRLGELYEELRARNTRGQMR